MVENAGRLAALTLAVFFVGAAAETSPPLLDNATFSPANGTNCTTEAPADSGFAVPIWVSVVFGAILLGLSGCFSGLTLGLLGLDTMALKAIAEGGDSPSREYAQRILPLREDGNLLLCTLLLGNVMVNVMIPILLAGLTDGLVGFVSSTFFIVIFGEIVPQATCSRYALKIGAKSIPLVSFFKFVLYVLAKPIALVLDKILGQDIGQVYDRNELKQLMWQHLHEDKLGKREFQIISRGLDLQKTPVEEIMTPEDKTYRLDINTELTLDKMVEIWQTGHSRIPVYERIRDPEAPPIQRMSGMACQPAREKEIYVGVLYTKDLITVRPEDKVNVGQILGFYNRGEPVKLDKSTKLDKVLDIFKKGKTHLALITETVSRNGGDPEVEVIGIVTLEDVIEQLVGEEIIDEHDNYEDIGAKRRLKTGRDTVSLSMLRHVAQQFSYDQALSVAKYLQYAVADPFAGLSEAQVVHLLLKAGIKELRLPGKEAPSNLDSDQNLWVYVKGRPMEFFTFILTGKLQVIAGEDRFRSEFGADKFLGARVLREGSNIKCDFDCRVLETPCKVVQISFADLEKARRYTGSEEDMFTPHLNSTEVQFKDSGKGGSFIGAFTAPDTGTTRVKSPTMRYSPTGTPLGTPRSPLAPDPTRCASDIQLNNL